MRIYVTLYFTWVDRTVTLGEHKKKDYIYICVCVRVCERACMQGLGMEPSPFTIEL